VLDLLRTNGDLSSVLLQPLLNVFFLFFIPLGFLRRPVAPLAL
jgi:hypothetical protein